MTMSATYELLEEFFSVEFCFVNVSISTYPIFNQTFNHTLIKVLKVRKSQLSRKEICLFKYINQIFLLVYNFKILQLNNLYNANRCS